MAQYESFHIWGEGKFCYDDEKVNRSKELIKEAEKALDSTKENIAKGFSSLLAAANIDKSPDLAENIRINEPVIEKFPEDCISYMEELYKMVESKQQEIEDYKNADGFKKFGMTIAMAGSKVLEGIASVGENIVDAGATLVGCVGGIFSSDFQNSCAEFIKKDHVGEAFHNFNEATGINKYSAMSENGTMAKVFKGIGVATGYIALAAATGGAVGALGGSISATTANVAVSAVGGFGAGTQTGLQEGKNFKEAVGEGIKQGGIQAATAYAAGKIGEKIQANSAQRIKDNYGDFVMTEQGPMSTDVLAKQAAKNTNTLYNNSATKAIEKGATNITGKASNFAETAATKVGDKVTNNGVVKAVTNNGAVKATTQYAKTIGSDVVQLGKDIVKPIGTIGSKVAGKGSEIISGVGKSSLVQGATSIGSKAVSLAAANPVVGNAISAGLVTTPTYLNVSKQTDIALENQSIEEIKKIDKIAEDIFGNNDITFPSNPDTNTEGNGANSESISESYNTDESGQQYSGGVSTSHTPNVAARQTSIGSSGGYYSSSGSSYTPSATIDNVTPMPNSSPTVGTTPTGGGTSSYQGTSSTGSTGSTGNSSAIIDNISNTHSNPINGGTSTSGSSSVGENTSTSGGSTIYEEPIKSTTSYSSSGTAHSGGGYSSSGYSFGGSDTTAAESATIDPSELASEDSTISSGTLASSVTSTNKFKNQTIKIPTTADPIETSSSNYAIPTAAALSAAAAAGIGAKAYIDRKDNNNEDEEDFSDGEENEGIYTENWEGNEDDIKIDYGTEENQTLDDEDDYSYSADSIIEKYEAVNNSELEGIQ